MVRIVNLYSMSVEIDGRVYCPETIPSNDFEKELVEILKRAKENIPWGRSLSLYKLAVWEELEEFVKVRRKSAKPTL